ARAHPAAPAAAKEPTLEHGWLMKDLDHLKLSPIVQSAPNDAGPVELGMITCSRRLLQQAVNEEHDSSGLHGGFDRFPEHVEFSWRHVGQPEAEENGVELRGAKNPVEQVCYDVLDSPGRHALTVDGYRLRRCIDGDDASIGRNQAASPEASATRKLQDVTLWKRLFECRFNHGQLAQPFRAMLGSPIVPSLAEEPFVVLLRSRPIVLNLLAEKFLLLHLYSQHTSRSRLGISRPARGRYPSHLLMNAFVASTLVERCRRGSCAAPDDDAAEQDAWPPARCYPICLPAYSGGPHNAGPRAPRG